MRYAPARDDGLMPYVVTTYSWGREHQEIRWSLSLAEAKRDYGWTRMAYASINVRRATPEDIDDTKATA